MPEASASHAVARRPDGWSRVRRNRPAMLSLAFLALVVALALAVPPLLPDHLKGTGEGLFQPPPAAGSYTSTVLDSPTPSQRPPRA